MVLAWESGKKPRCLGLGDGTENGGVVFGAKCLGDLCGLPA